VPCTQQQGWPQHTLPLRLRKEIQKMLWLAGEGGTLIALFISREKV